MFVGRETELSFLDERYESGRAEFIVLYGRRRVGKTELLTEFSAGKECFFFTCNEYTDRKQRQKFTEAMVDFDPAMAKTARGFRDWQDIFSALPRLSHRQKLVIVIDEFPYMCKGDKSIPSVLQSLWDHSLRNEDIMLIVSGSSVSFMEDELLSAKNPLYGRATAIYRLAPLPFDDAVRFFPGYSAEEKMIAYAILGGIPHYLKQFDPDRSLADNIVGRILTKGNVLFGEVEYILHQELREPATYNTILETVALGSTRFNEIAERSGIESSKLNVYLKSLMALGLVEKEVPVSTSEKDAARRSVGEYRICNNFFRFWFAFAYPNMTELEKGGAGEIWEYEIKDGLHRFASKAFEEICVEWLRKQRKEGNLPFRFRQIGRWWGKVRRKDENGKAFSVAEEIDILAYDREQTHFLLGECKFRNEPFDMPQLRAFRQKFDRPDKTVYYYVFSLSGFTKAVSEEEDKYLKLISVSDMMEKEAR